MNDFSIIIPHLGQNEEQERSLETCLTSLVETCTLPIVVSVNGKSTWINRPKVIDEHKDRFSIIINPEQGQCKAVNAAVATVKTPWIMVSNDDMVYSKGWFERLVKPIDEEYVQCISPMLVEPRPGAPTFVVQNLGGAGGDFRKDLWDAYSEEYYQYNHVLREGFNLPFIITRELWNLVGGYDVAYDPWGSNSDSDLLYKIRLAGIQPFQNTNAIVYHFSQTSGTFHPDNQGSWNRNWAYFIEKWGFPRTDDLIWEAGFQIPMPPIRKFTPEWEAKW